MIKKSIFILVFTFLFTACAERGAVLVDKSTNTVYASIKVGETEEDSSIPKLVLSHGKEEELKNNISGSMVLLIVLMILL